MLPSESPVIAADPYILPPMDYYSDSILCGRICRLTRSILLLVVGTVIETSGRKRQVLCSMVISHEVGGNVGGLSLGAIAPEEYLST